MRVPELILQPIVENAVKYGTKISELLLKITIEGPDTDDRLLLLKVTNTGHWVSTDDGGRTGKGVGMRTSGKRLTLIYADQYLYGRRKTAGWSVLSSGYRWKQEAGKQGSGDEGIGTFRLLNAPLRLPFPRVGVAGKWFPWRW